MRLGLQSSKLIPDTKTFQVYQNKQISERHRHRYEINENYISRLEDKGMIISARAAQDNLAEMIELKNHPWFIACQFHPEFSSTPVKPHPLFIAFLKASISYNKQKTIKQSVNRAI
jgi:CTP synthase